MNTKTLSAGLKNYLDRNDVDPKKNFKNLVDVSEQVSRELLENNKLNLKELQDIRDKVALFVRYSKK